MCGFAGLLSTAGFTRVELADHADRMIAPIQHRGPDDRGTWIDEHAGVAIGFRRLAILDLSPQGHQPMHSPSRRFVIAFNGEIYNFGDLRRELEQYGFTFQSQSDTEVALAAFEHWGIRDAVRRFIGMFAIAVWDAKRRELTLVRDRLGKKPLYVYQQPGLITFGSELKALFAGPAFDRSIDPAAVTSYLRYLCVPAPRTIFKRAIKLRAAHLMTVADPAVPLPRAVPYWSLEHVARRGLADPFTGDEQEAIERLDGLLAEAVRCRLRSDVPLGALLSGGIDSSMVVALMQEASARPTKTYTIGFAEDTFDESSHAARVAAHLGTDHTDLQLTPADAHALVPRLAEIFDEPFADPSQLPTLLVSQLARREVTVALCGDGGDELFGGYNRYVYGAQILSRVNRIPRLVRQPVGAGLGSVSAPAWDRLHHLTASLMSGVPKEHFGERVHKIGHLLNAASTGDMYRSLLAAWQCPESLLSGSVLPATDSHDDVTGRVFGADQPAHILDRMMLADQLMYLPDDLLAKVDRASMAVSLEVRAPLLDHRVAEFSWRLPRSMKVRGTQGKWILRQLLYRRVPKHLIERPKMGFSVPIDNWLRGPLREWAHALLFESGRGSGWFDMTAVARAWENLREGRPRAGTAVWAAVMLQAWRTRWAA
ncbi:MAG TPA: asparagine synthase (glutamine-hydrolyzing) [Vicinamibacterales bacterium]|nr:asparagine synthase (glutamine-hydrolyzing) [Vicinamibacterales bacterium]